MLARTSSALGGRAFSLHIHLNSLLPVSATLFLCFILAFQLMDILFLFSDCAGLLTGISVRS